MQEETRRLAGVLIGIHRRQRLKEDPAGGWTQDQFILDEAGEAICSRMTLYKLEQGQGIQDEERLELLLRKLGETPLKQPEQVDLRKERIQRLKQAYEQFDQKALGELLTDIEALPPTTQVIAMELQLCLSLIIEHLAFPDTQPHKPLYIRYREFDAKLKNQIFMYLDLAQALDEDLYVMMIVLFWQININQWTDRKLSETLLERLEQCEPHDGIWLHRKGTFLSALNRKAEALDCFNQVLSGSFPLPDAVRTLTEIMRFRIWKQFDPDDAFRRSGSFEQTLVALPKELTSQGWMELGLCLCEGGDEKGTERIDRALAQAPYLALYYLPHLFHCPLDSMRILNLAQVYLDSWTTPGTLAIYRYYEAKQAGEAPGLLQQRILKEILPEIEDTVYRPQELIPLLHDELLTLVQQSGSYKGLADFEQITKRRKPALIREIWING